MTELTIYAAENGRRPTVHGMFFRESLQTSAGSG